MGVHDSLFRDAVLSAYDFRCCITGLTVPELLNASHIVPWRDDPENRLNPANGLCLSTIHDRAFDKGLITIRDDLTVAVSRGVAEHAWEFFQASLGVFDGQLIAAPEKFSPAPDLLARHRGEIFRGEPSRSA